MEPVFGEGDASFRAAGGEAGIRRLVDAFYDEMTRRPEAVLIRAMHPADLRVARDKLARFLCGWLGGPPRYREAYGPIAIPAAHAHLRVDGAERDAWLACMRVAVDAQPYTVAFRRYLLEQLAIPAERVRVASVAAREGTDRER